MGGLRKRKWRSGIDIERSQPMVRLGTPWNANSPGKKEDSDGAAPCCPSRATDQGSPRKYVMRPHQISAPNVHEVRSLAYGVGGAKPEVRRCMETRTRHRQGRWLPAGAASADLTHPASLAPMGPARVAPPLARDRGPSTSERIRPHKRCLRALMP